MIVLAVAHGSDGEVSAAVVAIGVAWVLLAVLLAALAHALIVSTTRRDAGAAGVAAFRHPAAGNGPTSHVRVRPGGRLYDWSADPDFGERS